MEEIVVREEVVVDGVCVVGDLLVIIFSVVGEAVVVVVVVDVVVVVVANVVVTLSLISFEVSDDKSVLFNGASKQHLILDVGHCTSSKTS